MYTLSLSLSLSIYIYIYIDSQIISSNYFGIRQIFHIDQSLLSHLCHEMCAWDNDKVIKWCKCKFLTAGCLARALLSP